MRLVLVLMLLSLPPLGLRWWHAHSLPSLSLLPAGGTSTQHSGPTLEQIRKLATLVTTKAAISDAQQTVFFGRLGGCRAVLLVKGEALLGPDLAQARIAATDPERQHMMLDVPRPKVLSARLDHGSTRLVSLNHDGLWQLVPGDAGRTKVLNDAYRQAEEALAEASRSPHLIEQASQHAESVLRDFFATGGWSVEIHWIDGP